MDRHSPDLAPPHGAPASTGDTARPTAPKRSFASRWLGYDIFLSFALGPPPRGTHSYASDLARRLRERDFSVFFSPDGSRIVSGGRDGTLRLWPAPKAWPEALCKKLTRNMSYKEWRERVSPELEYIVQCPGLPIPSDEPAPQKTRNAVGETK